MLIIALVLAVIGLAALVTAVVTSNELIAWVCIGASVIGVLLLIVDALRERSKGADHEDADHSDDSDDADAETTAFAHPEAAEDYPDEPTSQFTTQPEAEPEADTTSVDEHDEETSRSKTD
ncbi:hypothetical protein [Mycobacterium sp. URHB0044]|uniref:hypothetical protein n=1 Tax=Mycobacterium sp. URHB0044 TaxID=1380386 RepID=UPI00055ACDD3|nr:hypothetical protein [Mycobacterium sp. URHB0044]